MIKADLWIPNIRGDLTLHEAVHSGRKDLVRWLLSQKSQNMVNVANNDGKCPLHIAAINNNVEMCKVKGVFSKLSGKYIVGQNLCFLR